MTAPHSPGGKRRYLVVLLSLAVVAFALSVFQVASQSPSKGFLTFLGHRVVIIDAEGPARDSGLQLGDQIVAIDGTAVTSTMDYVDRFLNRDAGSEVPIEFQRPGESQLRSATIVMTSTTPWLAIGGVVVSLGFTLLGLLALRRRPGDRSSKKFYAVSLVFSVFFVGAISWTQLLLHPVLAIIACVGLSLYGPVALDLALSFSSNVGARARRALRNYYILAGLLSCANVAAVLVAAWDFHQGAPSDRGLQAVLGLLAISHLVSMGALATSLVLAYRKMRRASGTERAQLLWLLIGFGLATLPSFTALPFAFSDFSAFVLVGYKPFLLAAVAMWFCATSLAALHVRLAEIDQIIYRSVAYAIVSTSALLLYIGVVFAVGYLTQSVMSRALFVPHAAAALSAVLLLRPLHARVLKWLDRRFFRDRAHYLQALRQLSETIMEIREPDQLASDLVEQLTLALRASSGALYLFETSSRAALAHSIGGEYAASATPGDLPLRTGGISVALAHEGEQSGVLLFGPRLDGNLFSSEDRDLLVALAGQLSTALANAQSFGMIAELSRTLESQNNEIGELKSRLEDENRYLRSRLEEGTKSEQLLGTSKVVQELKELMLMAARSEANVLLLGESGTGKGLVARRLHAGSQRSEGTLIHVDCGAIPASMFESELFGHERGAFTGARKMRRGHIELAQGGVLFLDEIGELPLALQPKLLRVLQERAFVRVGGSHEIPADIRIIAATNRNLEEMVAAKTFREDLYYRLRVLEILVPPLRLRKDDLAALASGMLPQLSQRNRRPLAKISPKALKKLRAYDWPGNVRELQNVLERALVLCESGSIDADDLALPRTTMAVPTAIVATGSVDHATEMRAVEKQKLMLVLAEAKGNKSSAARVLGMPRTTFINKLRKHELL
jgi:DNA-binding NtrC family response regulator/membrane-associated protease RseP (regulator of RpoE activity)